MLKKNLLGLKKNSLRFILCSVMILLSAFMITKIDRVHPEQKNPLLAVQNKLEYLLEDSYIQAMNNNSVKQQIVNYVNKNLSVRISVNDLEFQQDHYVIDSEKYHLQICFGSSLQQMIPEIVAYSYAVELSLTTEENNFTKTLDDMNLDSYISSVYRLFLEDNCFLIDSKSSRWVNEVKMSSCSYRLEYGSLTPISTLESDYIQGTITIPMYYDLEQYDSIKLANYVKKQNPENSSLQQVQIISNLTNRINSFYNDYFQYTQQSDLRSTVFFALTNSGSIMYVPITGLNETYQQGAAGYSGDIGELEPLQGKTINEIWTTIEFLESMDLCATRSYPRQCTTFASYWFYLQYGYDPLKGDGNMMAAALVRDCPDLFEKGCSPAPGSIVSIGSASGANHVICVDGVDYENQKIIISDANTFRPGNIRIRVEYTFEEFYNYCYRICYDSCNGDMTGYYINYANPIQ